MYSASSRRQRKNAKGIITKAALVVALGLALGAGVWFFVRHDPARPSKATPVNKTQTSPKAAKQNPTAPKPKLIPLQSTVDAWVATQKGEFSIVIYDPANDATLASYQPDKQYFTASIYKLFVVYLALEDIDSGKHTLNEAFRPGKTRGTCLYDAIHSSDSPCGEALLADIGNDAVNARIKAYSINDTSFPAFLTTAQDSVTILKRLLANKDLSKESTNFMLDAMRTQIYRDAIPKGMPLATVADKIGFYETGWHDSAIITLPDGRQYIMVVLTKDARSAQIADLAKTVYAQLTK